MRKLILMSLAILLLGLALATFVSAGDAQESPCIESCDSAGKTRDMFNPGECVCLKGSGLEPRSTYYIYIVRDYSPWVRDETRLTYLTIVVGPIPVSTDSNGYIINQPVLLWDSASPGYYDILADCQTRGTVGVYDAYDDLDDLDVVNAGFFVIPEAPLGVVGVLTVCFAGLGVRQLSRKRKGTL